MAPRNTTRSTPSTAADMPMEGGGNIPAPGQLTIIVAEKLEAAQRRIAELEKEIRIRGKLEAIEAQIR